MLSRRDLLRLTGAGLLATAFPSPAAEPAGFRFVVINDIHCRDERCHPWLRKLVASIRAHRPDFCLLNGDLSDNGAPAQLTAVKQAFATLGIPIYATLGNHDHDTDTTHTAFDQIFPGSLNYHFEHAGWQFIGLDSTAGTRVIFTDIQPPTLAWLDATLPTLDRSKPTVVCTHFPLGSFVLCRPMNADALLARFDGYNLRATFGGHWHGYAERHFEHAAVTNSRCGSWWRKNHDGSPEKGYLLCETSPNGDIRHQFCVVAPNI